QIYIACYQVVLCDDGHGVAKLSEHFHATTRYSQLFFNRLITIRVPAHGDDARFPARRHEFLAQQFGRILFYHDFALEIDSGGESQISVRGPRITIDAAMLAAAIWVDAGVETDVRRVVVGQD